MSSEAKHLHPEPQYKPRSYYGVVASLQLLENGKVRLVLDDVCSQTDNWPQMWQSHYPFTQNDFERQKFLASELSEQQLAHIGLILVARLSALTTNKQQ